jgi:hypothetical protein
MENMLTRRSFTQLAGTQLASVAAGSVASSGGAARAAAPALDLVTPKGNLHAFMKLHTSVEKARIWYWYTGIMEAALVGGPVIPFCATDTLIRRDVYPTGDGRFKMEMFEANYFHPIGDHTPLLRMHNPLNDRDVEPFHYREGPHEAFYSEQGPYLAAMPPPGKDAPPFAPPWTRVEDQLSVSINYYIDTPYPLPLDKWPLEANTRERVGSFATMIGNYDEVADPRVATAKCAFHYEAFMVWWPWMLMGQTPGRMLWHANGRKLASLDGMPMESRIGFEAIHPRIFEERPWEEMANLGIDYQKERTPVLR